MRILVLIHARNCGAHIGRLLDEVRTRLVVREGVDVLVVDDASADDTLAQARHAAAAYPRGRIRVVGNEFLNGYGGVLKTGMGHAISRKYEGIVTLDGRDVKVGETVLPLIGALEADPETACAVGIGPRLLDRLSPMAWLANRLSGMRFRGWCTGARAYRTSALMTIAFELNTSRAHFLTEVLLQLADHGHHIAEVTLRRAPRGRIGCSVPSPVLNVLKACITFRLQRYNLFYDVRYHPEVLRDGGTSRRHPPRYDSKFELRSPHSLVCEGDALVSPGSRVLDAGCASGYISSFLAREKQCRVTAVDVLPPERFEGAPFTYVMLDLETEAAELATIIEREGTEVILMLDVLEHVSNPEVLLHSLYRKGFVPPPRFVISTGNVAFFVVRLMLLYGFFNYGEKGILDVSHKRLFTLRTFRNLLEQTGFVVLRMYYFPVPFRKLGFSPRTSRVFEAVNIFLIRLFPALFSYQVMCEAVPHTLPDAMPGDGDALDLGIGDHLVETPTDR